MIISPRNEMCVNNSPKDKIVYDVSHQSYIYKILTGRKEVLINSEKCDEVSGYTNSEENKHDFFNIGHTSISISLACGFTKSRDLKIDKDNVITIIM